MANVPLDTRFIGISPDVNLTERKSSSINAETQPYTMADIAETAGGGGGGCLRYVALIYQAGTDDPVPTVLENTLGATITFSRIGVGQYSITTSGIFPQDKTWAVINTPSYNGNGPFALQIGRISDTQCYFYSYYLNDTLEELSTQQDRTSIEIRVYP